MQVCIALLGSVSEPKRFVQKQDNNMYCKSGLINVIGSQNLIFFSPALTLHPGDHGKCISSDILHINSIR